MKISVSQYSLLERFVALGFGVISFFLMVRMLPKEDFGAWVLFITVTTFVEIARHGFLKNPLIRFLSTAKEGENEIIQSASLILNFAYWLFFAVLVLLFGRPLALSFEVPALEDLLYLYVFTSFFLSAFFHVEYIQRSNLRFDRTMWGYTVYKGIFSASVVYFFFFKPDVTLYTLGLCYTGSAVIASMFLLISSRDSLYKFKFYGSHWVRKLLGYGKYTLLTNLGASLLRNIDVYMIGWFITPQAVAIYNVAIRVANYFEVPTNALASTLLPMVAKESQHGTKGVKKLYERTVATILCISIPFVLFILIFAEEVILLIADKDYIEAADILRVTIFYGIIIPFHKQFGVVLDAVGRAKTNTLITLRNAAVNIVLNYFLITNYGVIGAAYATLITMFLTQLINFIYLKKWFKITLKDILGYFPVLIGELKKKYI